MITTKEQGQQLAQNSAGVDWYTAMLAKLREYIETLKGSKVHAIRIDGGAHVGLTFDGFRAWTEEPLRRISIPEPRSVNAWGSLPRKAVEAGIVEATYSYTKANRTESRSRAVRVWKAL